MSVLWRLVPSMLTLLALGGAAFAQAGDTTMLKEKDDAEGKQIRQYIDRMQTDEQYQKTIREQQAAPSPNDPWGSVRPTTTSGAKPATKPATATKSASGTVKPNAASATSATPKNQ